jgi:3-oxoacyl-[acyl-carrier protein] reductase
MPGRYLVEVLAKELGHRGITANSIVPYATEGAGIFTEEGHWALKQLIAASPMARLARVEDVANVAEFFASELSSFVNGQHLLVNGGANL